jgi:putative ABC transport system permease protein
VDVKTTWVIEGLAHGHADLARPEAAPGVLRRDENVITANESVVQYNEITDENIGSFHFHGDPADFPITAVIAVPPDDRSAAILMGRYLSDEQRQQIVRPAEVMDELLATILTVQSFVVAAVIIVGAATLATASLVVLLSLRLRRREIETMVKIGGARGRIVAVLAAEVVGVAAGGVGLAFVLTWMTSAFGSELIRSIFLK